MLAHYFSFADSAQAWVSVSLFESSLLTACAVYLWYVSNRILASTTKTHFDRGTVTLYRGSVSCPSSLVRKEGRIIVISITVISIIVIAIIAIDF